MFFFLFSTPNSFFYYVCLWKFSQLVLMTMTLFQWLKKNKSPNHLTDQTQWFQVFCFLIFSSTTKIPGMTEKMWQVGCNMVYFRQFGKQLQKDLLPGWIFDSMKWWYSEDGGVLFSTYRMNLQSTGWKCLFFVTQKTFYVGNLEVYYGKPSDAQYNQANTPTVLVYRLLGEVKGSNRNVDLW